MTSDGQNIADYFPPATDMSADQALAALAWLVDMGADEAIGETPMDHFAAAAATQKRGQAAAEQSAPNRHTPAQQPTQARAKTSSRPLASSASVSGTLDMAESAASAAADLHALATALQNFDGFARRATCKTPVLGAGPEDADLMVIAKAPTAPQEDQSGQLFVGDTAPLVSAMFAAIHHPIESSIRTAALVPWREPGGRDHAAETYALYIPFLRRHIELIKPKMILSLGAAPAVTLLGRAGDSMSKLRGKIHQADINGHPVNMLVTHHPDSLIRQPLMKAMVWQDLLSLKAQLEHS